MVAWDSTVEANTDCNGECKCFKTGWSGDSQLYKFTQTHVTIHLKWVDFTECKSFLNRGF